MGAPSDLGEGCTAVMAGGTGGGGGGQQEGDVLPAWWSEWLSDQG